VEAGTILTTTSDRAAALAAWRRLGHDEPRMLRASDVEGLGLRRTFPDALDESFLAVAWGMVLTGVAFVLLPFAVGIGIWTGVAFGRCSWPGAPLVGVATTALVVALPMMSLTLLGALRIVLA